MYSKTPAKCVSKKLVTHVFPMTVLHTADFTQCINLSYSSMVYIYTIKLRIITNLSHVMHVMFDTSCHDATGGGVRSQLSLFLNLYICVGVYQVVDDAVGP